MTTSGQPAPGKRITLPSGAVWEGGPTAGTSLITLPDEDPILVSDNGSGAPNALVGRSGPFGALARAFEEVLGHVPNFVTDRVAAETRNLLRGLPAPEEGETETRIIKFSSKATLINPAKKRGGSGGDEVVEQHDQDPDETPIRRARGGLVHRPGDFISGLIPGLGPSTADDVSLRASRGEYVVNAEATANTLSLLDAINAGWVPSAQFLTGMLEGFSSPMPETVATTPTLEQWRGLLGQGVIADMLGNAGAAAVNAAGWAGSALGSALAPLFQPGGPLSAQAQNTANPPVQTPPSSTAPGSPLPLTASMQAKPSGMLGALAGLGVPGIGNGTTGNGITELGALSSALSSGIAGAAAEAGSRVGAALGAVIAPALGPSGQLVPEIGEQLGRLIGSQFGGELTASMSLRTEIPGQPGTGAGGGAGATTSPDGTPTVGSGAGSPTSGGGSIVGGAGPAAASGVYDAAGEGSRWVYLPSDPEKGLTGGWAYVTPTDSGVRTAAPPAGTQIESMMPDKDGVAPPMVDSLGSVDWFGALTENGPKSLALESHPYNQYEGNFKDLLQLASEKVGGDLGTLLTPILGANAPDALGKLAAVLTAPIGQAYADADPNGDWTNTIGYWLSQATGIPWSPTGQQGSGGVPQPSIPEQIGLNALSSGIQGLQQGGLLRGLTGAISSAVSSAGSLIGSAAGTLIAPFLGPAAPLGPVIGQMLGSMVGGVIGDQLTRPIEWAGYAVKELVGTGFGLTDLAEGPGGHTARVDIYNFNGTDPKSASIAVERVRRRRALAQQRGGGFGR
ncbi:hypothetical protein [Nocardia sp. CC227C]|uniref:hypothetical protein n=1 Tax=Nocardia sp. CC227C TaxID=3044562 RepID=UPI00278C3709|nr:hypothetical protein [Nocardia sp. CC227C]